MHKALAGLALLVCAVPSLCAQDLRKESTPGELIAIEVKGDLRDIHARVGDLLEFRIANPLPARPLAAPQVSVAGAARQAAVVNTVSIVNGVPVPGSKAISVFVTVERPGPAEVRIAFVDTDNRPISREYTFVAR